MICKLWFEYIVLVSNVMLVFLGGCFDFLMGVLVCWLRDRLVLKGIIEEDIFEWVMRKMFLEYVSKWFFGLYLVFVLRYL